MIIEIRWRRRSNGRREVFPHVAWSPSEFVYVMCLWNSVTGFCTTGWGHGKINILSCWANLCICNGVVVVASLPHLYFVPSFSLSLALCFSPLTCRRQRELDCCAFSTFLQKSAIILLLGSPASPTNSTLSWNTRNKWRLKRVKCKTCPQKPV